MPADHTVLGLLFEPLRAVIRGFAFHCTALRARHQRRPATNVMRKPQSVMTPKVPRSQRPASLADFDANVVSAKAPTAHVTTPTSKSIGGFFFVALSRSATTVDFFKQRGHRSALALGSGSWQNVQNIRTS